MRRTLVPVLTALAAVCVTIAFQSPASATPAPDPGAPPREALATRGHDRYVTAMRAIAEYAAAVAPQCPVPGSTFVDTFGAPRDGHTHQGVDMMAPDGTPIYAPTSGVYEQHGTESFYLHADDGTLYFGTHLQDHVAPSGPVRKGQEIALVGHSGNASASAPHLHFEIHPGGGDAVDPYPATEAMCSGAPVEAAALTVTPTMSWPYGPGETQRWYNAQHPQPERISRPEARVLARYLNGIVWGLVVRYVRAVTPAIPYEANWDRVAMCESGGRWDLNTGNNFYGGVQFDYGTWLGAGGGEYASRADLASKLEQILIAERVRADRGMSPWPSCGHLWYG